VEEGTRRLTGTIFGGQNRTTASYKENKDQVIADYLNNVYFGGNAYGVEVASEAYFNKSVPDLAVVR
jgi:membrane carboxypeptidase/penicillin-binding protein